MLYLRNSAERGSKTKSIDLPVSTCDIYPRVDKGQWCVESKEKKKGGATSFFFLSSLLGVCLLSGHDSIQK